LKKYFEQFLKPHQILDGEALTSRTHHIWEPEQPLKAALMVLPENTDQVSKILGWCHQNKQAVVIHGGRTNLVGGTESDDHELIISLEQMNTILEIDAASRTVTVESGVILQNLQEAVQQEKLLFPLNFGAKGSAQLGGIIATNAGGLRVFRYGMTRSLVLGLEVVLADGTVISSLKKIIKDNSGYDLKQLFIGSEGTLGVITKATLRLFETPKFRVSAFVGVNSYTNVISLLKHLDGSMGGTLSGFEVMWPMTYQTLTGPSSRHAPPLPYGFEYYLLCESMGSDPNHQALFEEALDQALNQSLAEEVVMATSSAEHDWFWGIREEVDVMVDKCMYDQHFDISLAPVLIGDYAQKVIRTLSKIELITHCFCFGHLADGNIHLVVGKSDNSAGLSHQINEIVYQPLKELQGSISAEHGIGTHKKAYLQHSKNPSEIALMKTLKQALDPNYILNRGKIID